MDIILASESLEKLNILKKMKLNPKVIPAYIDETEFINEKPENLALRLSLEKASKIALNHYGYIIGADTVAVCDEEILPKTTSDFLIRDCMHKYSDKIRIEITGICIIKNSLQEKIIEQKAIINKIYFNSLSEKEIEFYIQTKEAINTAGGFKISGIGEIFINKIEGVPSAISGLPMNSIYQILKKLGYKFF